MFKVNFPYDETMRQIRAARGRLEQDKVELLDLVGTQLLSLSQQAYQQKSRGQRGDDGITWAKLTRRTIKARVLQRAPGQAIVKQRKQLADQIRALLASRKVKKRTTPRKKGKIGARALNRRKRMMTLRAKSPTRAIKQILKRMPKIKGAGATIAEKVAKLRRKRMELLLKLEQMVDREMANHAIGINTGLQRSSASPGFKATDGKGGNLFEKGADFVTIGYARNYSKFFDEKRELMPKEMPANWQKRIDGIATQWMEKKARGLFD